ncbi:MAG: tetratricopeptide repeat protein, partial [Planctomycetes bacterium]|nr:tetratricopeptide repeat protein [Planctomycetota bacterium]
CDLGNLHLKIGRPQQAAKALQSCVEIRESIVRDFPAYANQRRGLGDAYELLGESLIQAGHFDEAVTAYENFNNEVTAKIRSLLGERAEAIAGIVLVKLEAQESDIDDDQMNVFTRERIEKDRETMRPRHETPFINASEFKQCVETIAFADEERKAIFESLYDDFHDGFIWAREKQENDYRFAKEKDILENPSRPTHLPSGQRNPFPSFTLMTDWSQRWVKLRLRLEGEFADQVRLFLSDEEHHLWDREVRRLRRLRMLPAIQTHLTGAQDQYVYDLIELVETLDLKPLENEGFSKLLHDCEMAIDAVCYRFESEYDALISEIFALNAAQQDPPSVKLEARRERINKSFMEIREAPPKVRHKFVQLISEALDASERQRFLEAIDKQEYPWLQVESPSDMFRAALRRDNVLDADQFLVLDKHEKQLNFTRKEFRRQYLALMRRYDKEKDTERLLSLMDDIFKMALRRSDIDRNSIHDLSRLISPHQHEELSLDIRMLLVTSR